MHLYIFAECVRRIIAVSARIHFSTDLICVDSDGEGRNLAVFVVDVAFARYCRTFFVQIGYGHGVDSDAPAVGN